MNDRGSEMMEESFMVEELKIRFFINIFKFIKTIKIFQHFKLLILKIT